MWVGGWAGLIIQRASFFFRVCEGAESVCTCREYVRVQVIREGVGNA